MKSIIHLEKHGTPKTKKFKKRTFLSVCYSIIGIVVVVVVFIIVVVAVVDIIAATSVADAICCLHLFVFFFFLCFCVFVVTCITPEIGVSVSGICGANNIKRNALISVLQQIKCIMLRDIGPLVLLMTFWKHQTNGNANVVCLSRSRSHSLVPCNTN